MAGKSMKTIFDVLARDGATPILNKVTSSFGSMRNAARNANMALGGMNAGVAEMQRRMRTAMAGGIVGAGFLKVGSQLQNFVGNTVKQAGELEFELATLKGISGATASEMERLSAAASKAGVETQFTPTESVKGLAALAQQGFTTAQQLDALMPSLLLAGASGGKIPLEEGAKLTTQTLKAFGLSADKAGILVDQLVKTTTQSGLSIEELTESMQNASAGAISMGLGVEDSLAALGLIKNIIPSAAMAGSAFQIMTGRLSATRTQKKIKAAMGIDIVDQATGKYMAFDKLLVEMSKKLGKMEEGKRGALVGEAFGERAKKGILSIFKQLDTGVTTTEGKVLKGAAAFAYYKDQLDPEVVNGFAKSMNDMKLDTLNGQITLLTGSVQTFMMEMGKGSAQFSKHIVKAFLGGFNTMLSVFQELPSGLKTGISTFLLLGATIIKFIGILLIARTGLRLFGFTFSGLLLSIGKMLLLAAPLTLFFGGIALGAYGVYRAVSTNFGRSERSAASFTDKVKMAFKGLVDIVKTGGLTKETEKQFLKMGKSPMLSAFFKRFISMWRNAKAFFDGVLVGFDQGMVRLEAPWNRFTDVVSRIFNIWTGGTDNAIKSTDDWNQRGEKFGDMMVDLSEVVLDLMTKFAEFSEDASVSLSKIDPVDLVTKFEILLISVTSIADTIGIIGEVFDKVGTGIGEGIGFLIVKLQAFGMGIKALATGNQKLMDSSKALNDQADAGMNSSLLARGLSNDAKSRFGLLSRGMTSTKLIAESRLNIAKNLASATPFSESEVLSKKERKFATQKDQQTVESMNASIQRLNERLSQRQQEIVQQQSGRGYKDTPQSTKDALAKELALIKQALSQTPKVLMVNVDGKRMFEVVMDQTEEDNEDNFDNPDMSNVTQGGG